MKKFKGLVLFLSLVLLISLAAPALAAPPDDNPGKGPPEYDVTVFVHYGDDARGVKPDNPGGGKGGGGGGKNKEPKLYSYSGVHWEAPANVTYGINPSGARVA